MGVSKIVKQFVPPPLRPFVDKFPSLNFARCEQYIRSQIYNLPPTQKVLMKMCKFIVRKSLGFPRPVSIYMIDDGF